mmetsp:Transcript_99399/g.285986  ORF Transcript_99399/g.285986 Transcript_99399/m.285986 type:complete len:203 (+) Transcript_99399:510-1118(+)
MCNTSGRHPRCSGCRTGLPGGLPGCRYKLPATLRLRRPLSSSGPPVWRTSTETRPCRLRRRAWRCSGLLQALLPRHTAAQTRQSTVVRCPMGRTRRLQAIIRQCTAVVPSRRRMVGPWLQAATSLAQVDWRLSRFSPWPPPSRLPPCRRRADRRSARRSRARPPREPWEERSARPATGRSWSSGCASGGRGPTARRRSRRRR